MKDLNFTEILPPELITEILLRVPVKSLLKFRSVSKFWLTLISSRQFIKNHLSLSANNKEDTHHVLIYGQSRYYKGNFKECLFRSLFNDSVTEAFDLKYPIENDSKLFNVLGSCNGLIFLADYLECSLLWNPTTRMHKNLPDIRPRWKKYYVEYGFGYDELRDDYKVLGIFYNRCGLDGGEVKIYSLKSDSWTSVDYIGEEILNTSDSNRKMRLGYSGFFVNGKLHWDTITFGPNPGDVCRCRDIIYFDLANEKWEKVEKPSYGVGETDLYMGTLGSDLCVFRDYNETQLGVWVMNGYGVKESWIKKFTITYPIKQVLYPPLFMSNNGEMLATLGTITSIMYNSKDDAFRYPHVINCNDFHGVAIYVESLVCPFSTEVTEKATKQRRKKLRSKPLRNK
ncbi:F-box/kelch-repeat protein At3g23880-like [Solanum tuberosum]|uniref:F-Box protein n=1 Tax=Solanum tuberosum TaxID=4113 RepID=M1AWL8_SOLTU|nr:PREDICTED: F-box/kelch-repeat protein At3g23880-like [Solanum tuberosum]KAH0707238.1 hypothetical protein KY289_012314 [Solanum tuberosum]KAH0736154.1 hypothetical protein KY285_011861 [Solanum tuberosum]